MLVKAIVGVGLGMGILLAANAGAAAAFDPYTSGAVGYDFSYPQCGASAPPARFGIVGVNAGYPFTYYNSCLAAEFVAATRTGNAALYINTGYDPSYTAVDDRHSTQDCATRSTAIVATSDQQAAWAVGCSEAERDLAYAAAQGASAPTAWWLDVEAANSWSTADLSLNRYTIDGVVATFRAQTAAPVGVYSTPSQWATVTGGYQAQVDADWVATGMRTLKRARTQCGAAGFTGSPVWLVQYVTTVDNDYVC